MKKTVFIINNNKEEVDQLRQVITQVNRQSRCFAYSNSLTALRRLYEVRTKPQLIILDLGMPLIGKDWLVLLKNEPTLSAIPVIVCSDVRSLRQRQASITQHAFDVFVKPFPYCAIEEKLKEVLEPTSILNGSDPSQPKGNDSQVSYFGGREN